MPTKPTRRLWLVGSVLVVSIAVIVFLSSPFALLPSDQVAGDLAPPHPTETPRIPTAPPPPDGNDLPPTRTAPTPAPQPEPDSIPNPDPVPDLDPDSDSDPILNSDPDPDPVPEPEPRTAADLGEHIAACHQQLDSRQPGRVAYPRSLEVPLNQSATYKASLDIRPGAQQRSAPNADTAVGDVEVRCGVGARVLSDGDSITIEDEGEWVYRQFDTPGVFEWAWSIRATKADDTSVTLELRPAVAVQGGGYVVPGNDDPRAPTVSYESDIDVQADAIDEASFWAENTWPKIAGIAVVVGGVLIGLATWVRKFTSAIRGGEESGVSRDRVPMPAVSTEATRTTRSASPPQKAQQRRGKRRAQQGRG